MALKSKCMIHLRYDWRRPAFLASICLILFLNSSTLKNNSPTIERSNALDEDVKYDIRNQKSSIVEMNNESKFSLYFFIAKQ